MRKAKRTAVPAAEVLKAYNKGASLAELKEKYGISGKVQLARIVFEAMIASGKMPPLVRGRKKKAAPTEFKVAVNKRGTIVLHKAAVVDAFGLKVGQSFVVTKRGTKITLTTAS